MSITILSFCSVFFFLRKIIKVKAIPRHDTDHVSDKKVKEDLLFLLILPEAFQSYFTVKVSDFEE